MSAGKNFRKWSWFREVGYFVGGMYGRPWSLTFQWNRGRYANLDFSAPGLGDCGLSWHSREWRNHPIYGRGRDRRLTFARRSWAAIDALEKR